MFDNNTTMAMLQIYEDKLRELMGAADYSKFAEETARATFLSEVMAMPDGEFKQMIIDKWDSITAPVMSV